MGSCTLGAIEQAQLGHTRRDDLPGALCPSLYFAWLRTGAASGALAGLEPVLRHNRDDVLSLVTLALELLRRCEHGAEPAELIGLGQHWRRRKRWPQAHRALERARALAEGEVQALHATERTTLYAELGAVRARLGDLAGARAAWLALFTLPEPPIGALEALAKLAEHRLGELALAERATVAALSRVRRGAVSCAQRARLERALSHRLARIRRKQRRRAQSGASSSKRRNAGCSVKNRR